MYFPYCLLSPNPFASFFYFFLGIGESCGFPKERGTETAYTYFVYYIIFYWFISKRGSIYSLVLDNLGTLF